MPPKEPSGMREWIRGRIEKPNTFAFIIELRHPEDPAALGTAVNIIGSAGGNRTPEFGYSIDADHWGKGYATEAMRAILDAFWDTWPEGMPSIPKAVRNEASLRVSPSNVGSVAVARKLGFIEIGEEVLDGTGGAADGKIIVRYRLKRPREGPDRPKAYERIEITGPNTCAGPPLDD
jgi:RimJ/RimL family protein N-acetyltransferase